MEKSKSEFLDSNGKLIIAKDKMSNITFAIILPYADNMIEFGMDKETIQEIIYPKMTQYKMSKELMESIKSIVNSK